MKSIFRPKMNGLFKEGYCLFLVSLEGVGGGNGVKNMSALRFQLECLLQMAHGGIQFSTI